MNFTLLNPFFLLGLMAAALPVLIHRLARRRAVVKRFSAVRLLIKSQQAMTKPQRLKHLFLLALRVLAVACLVLLMARPLLVRPGFLNVQDGTATLLIVDNSMSMGYREDHGKRFDIAREVAGEIAGRLNGKIAVLSTASFQKDPRWMSRGESLRELENLSLSPGRGDPASALSRGYRLLEETKGPGEILILTDMARGDWEGFNLSKIGKVSSESRVSFLRIGGPNRDPNVAVREMNLIEGEPVVSVPGRIEVVLSNFSDQPGEILVQLYLSQTKKDQKSATIESMGQAKVYFEIFFDRPGRADGEIRISGDRLAPDDILYFSFNVKEKIKTLVVDGDPRTSLRASESYYLLNALHPGGAESSPFQVQVVTEEEFSYANTDPYEAIFLLNVARPRVSRLLPVLESGRPVFIFLGDRVIPGEYNGFPLSPLKIREMKETVPVGITEVNPARPILKSISGAGGGSLQTALFRRYFKIEGRAKPLLTLKNGDPLLIETEVGKGKIFLFASTADLDWNDFPLKAAYLPLVQGLLKEAVGLVNGTAPPTGGSPDLERKPGSHRISMPPGEPGGSIHSPLIESDLGKVSPDEMKKKFGKIDLQVAQYHEDILNEAHSGGRKELWPFLLCFVLLVLGVEMAVSGKI